MIKADELLSIILIIAIFFFSAILVSAQSIPPYIFYQGRLIDQTTGKPINQVKSITFSLYETPTGETSIYSQTKEVDINKGVFIIYLGKGEGIYNGNIIEDGIPAEVFTKHSTQYLGIKVEDSESEMAPRQLIASVAYAYKASRAKEAENVMGEITVDSSTGNVGIGIMNPAEKLEVAGTIKATAFAGAGSTLTGLLYPSRLPRIKSCSASICQISPGIVLLGDKAVKRTSGATFDITKNGLGGLDTGSEQPSVIYFLYAVDNRDKSWDIVGSLNEPASAGGIGPIGYDNYTYIGAVSNNGGATIDQGWTCTSRGIDGSDLIDCETIGNQLWYSEKVLIHRAWGCAHDCDHTVGCTLSFDSKHIMPDYVRQYYKRAIAQSNEKNAIVSANVLGSGVQVNNTGATWANYPESYNSDYGWQSKKEGNQVLKTHVHRITFPFGCNGARGYILGYIDKYIGTTQDGY